MEENEMVNQFKDLGEFVELATLYLDFRFFIRVGSRDSRAMSVRLNIGERT